MNISEKIKQNFSAFLSSFSVQPAEQAATESENIEAPDKTLNTLFEAFCASYPESFSEVEGFTQLQKAESITAFLESLASKNSLISESLAELNATHEALLATSAFVESELAKANSRITELTEQLSARPSIPLNVTDPLLNVGHNAEKDETGKQILSQLPKDLKRKLKQS